MNGWMDEWMNGWMNEWMDGWMNGWMNGWMDEWMNEWINEWMNGWMNEWMNGWMDGCWRTIGWFKFVLVCLTWIKALRTGRYVWSCCAFLWKYWDPWSETQRVACPQWHKWKTTCPLTYKRRAKPWSFEQKCRVISERWQIASKVWSIWQLWRVWGNQQKPFWWHQLCFQPQWWSQRYSMSL